MIKIGDFAKIFDVSTKTVRYYEEIGLLVPYEVDIYSGYRYFDEDNVKRMGEILALKDLGFSLEEIKNFNDKEIKSKISDYERKINDMKSKIKSLKDLSFNGKGVLKMKFINDENAIGKWELLGVSDNISNAKERKYIDDDYNINELYLMPNGEKYWVVSWTKGIVRFGNIENTYEIIDDIMYLTIIGLYDNDKKVAVYKKMDSKEYTKEEIKIKDDTNLEFVEDKDLVGFWKSVDCIKNKNSFNPSKKQCKLDLFLTEIAITPNNNVMITYSDGKAKKSGYTKGSIYNLCLDNTVCKYEYQEIADKTYLIIEWKSGDYVYGGLITCYYVLEKQK